MSSKAHRLKVRAERRRKHAHPPAPLDPHAEVVLGSFASMLDAIGRFAASDDPVAEIETALAGLVEQIAVSFRRFDPARVIEVARMACLPWSSSGEPLSAGTQNGPTQAELIAIIAVSSAQLRPDREGVETDGQRQDESLNDEEIGSARSSNNQEADTERLTDVVNDAIPVIDQVLELGQLREMATADHEDPLALVIASVRASQVWIRSTSYPDMVNKTLIDLFDEPGISAVLRSDLGFGVRDALSALDSCHALQVERFNDRMHDMGAATLGAYASAQDGSFDDAVRDEARRVWNEAWEPSAEAATVSAAEIAETSGLDTAVVEAVLRFFALDISGKSPRDVVDDFIGGSSPLRNHPVIRFSDRRVMLVHDAQNPVAIREGLEQYLKDSPTWDAYQKHRGDLLEGLARALFARVLPGARTWNGFNYYVPVSDAEAAGEPASYTKRVEGDHLIVQDDMAIIVEDKAVAWSGQGQRLRRDLTGVIQKAAAQATRLQERIQQDGGVRVHGEGWIDLSRIREIHTVAVSLDDLSGASTATADLIRAGLLDANHVPWTVSIHDLDLITRLVDRPAEFLLYLRRRRDPETTVFYTAPDELDLFLYFFEAGLYVEPDPQKVRAALPWLPPPTTGERRRRRQQRPGYITSRTDALDRWHYAQIAAAQAEESHYTPDTTAAVPGDTDDSPGEADEDSRKLGTITTDLPHRSARATGAADVDSGSDAVSRKPRMVPSPLEHLVDELHARGVYAWLSIGATLLEGSTEFQHKLAGVPRELLDNPFGDGRQRSVAIAFPGSGEDGWLLVWVTRPQGRDPDSFERDTKDYLRVKQHQLGFPRAVAFSFDETTRELIGVYFDDHVGELEPRLEARLRSLEPPERMSHRVPPQAKTRPGSKQRSEPKRSKK
jgi:hypothetical protein